MEIGIEGGGAGGMIYRVVVSLMRWYNKSVTENSAFYLPIEAPYPASVCFCDKNWQGRMRGFCLGAS